MELIEGFWYIIRHYQDIREGLTKVKQGLEEISTSLNEIKEVIELIKSVSQSIKKLSDDILGFLRRKINLSIWRQMHMNTPEISFTYTNNFIENISIDEEISKELRNQKFCYVLSSPKDIRELLLRKIKSSLTAVTGVCKLTIIKSELFTDNEKKSEQLWFGKIIDKINQDLNLNCSAIEWIRQNQTIQNNSQKLLKKYMEEKVIVGIENANYIIIVDGIQKIFKPLKFRTDFFSIIDHCYAQRTKNDRYKKINFLLFDSADPNIDSDATIDAATGTNNSAVSYITVGWVANRDDIIAPKVEIIKSKRQDFWGNIDVDKILSDIWESTDGHPLLTQEIFKQLIRNKSHIAAGQEAKFVQQQIDHLIQGIGN